MSEFDIELHKRICGLELMTRKLKTTKLIGQYDSLFKGQGMEFSEFRDYHPGDEAKMIDWRASAKSQKLLIRRNQEERELRVILLVDVSQSCQNKIEKISELVAIMTFLAMQSHDKVGLGLFTDELEYYLSPSAGRKHGLRLIREMLYYKPQSKQTSLQTVSRELHSQLKKPSLIFIFTDLWSDIPLKNLQLLQNRHELSVVCLDDPKEWQLGGLPYLHLQDSETRSHLRLKTNAASFQQELKQKRESFINQRNKALISSQADVLTVTIEENPFFILQRLFQLKRSRR